MTEPLADERRTPLRAGGGYLESAVPRGRHRVADPGPEPAEYLVADLAEPPAPVAPAPEPPAPEPPAAPVALPRRKAAAEPTAEPTAEPSAPVAEPVAAAAVVQPAPAPEAPAPAREPDPVRRAPRRPAPPITPRASAVPAADFYGSSTGRPAFSPGNASPFHVPRTEAVPKRVGKNPVKTLVTWATVLVVGAIGVKYGYPVVMDKVHAKEIQAVSADLRNVAAGQDAYHGFNGAYAGDFASLDLPQTVDEVVVVTATTTTYCLRGESRTGHVVRYFSPAQGVTTVPCG
ncbi:hypothetical protein [Kineococcus rhizosphaerae]|uniref:Uncharacterized protein n=1 Tax=Kineococcus rhizosphaerae TaxID=559628 RepID=A0A2T0R9V7_9ACTN|nr:hypothetical protein [Kineococcus rhizosphaerae]PRY17920.1 hypothetical protein CLV37_101162 [Kineococcus rhizosphaerae]